MASIMDPHDKMRSKDLSKVAKGQQAARPQHEPGSTVSAPPPPSSTTTPEEKQNEQEAKTRHCYSCYVEYLKCTKQKGEQASECKKLADNYRSTCPPQWIKKWDEEKKHGIIHNHA
ncbi:cytochrome c oxidase, subunit Vib family protein [Artemisia annua]|uniref:Cytochrome c oxidase, subunit Vib family protein n=1 Tax=Artemisia annua TaxID=35608 RepID=A0A2U1KLX5_ARTAN|nr:cytochrome c oxidase, subunit Vib family protein [Artemisia annua]